MRPPTVPLLLFSSLVALTLPLSAQASAQSNQALMTGDRYSRPHDYDLLHQRIVVSNFNWDSTSLAGSVTSTLVSQRAGLDAVILDEGRLLTNTSVKDRDGRTLATSRSGDTLVVHPAHALRLGDTLTFTVTYHGRVKSGDGLTFITNDGLPHRPDQIWSMGETYGNHHWFPTYDFPNDKLTWELIATVPAEDLAISNGRLVSNVVAGAVRTLTWREDEPSASYLISLIVAPLVVTHDSWQGMPVDYYTYRGDSARAWPLFHVTPDMIDVYSRLTGVRYPWAKYAQSTVADFFGGQENVSATTLVDWLPDTRAYRDRPWYQYILIPHELAHQWFGDYVTTANWANTWLNEGFAEFMPGQYWREKLGAAAEQDYYLDEYRQFLEIESQRSMPLASLGSNNIYPKGALVLRMLEAYLGPDRFWAGLHTYLTRHAFGIATTEDLRAAVEASSGEHLDWFWDQWIYAAGLPKLAVTAAWDAATARLTLGVQQMQVDSFKPDSTGRLFRVPQAFRLPVAVRVAWQGGSRTYPIEINQRQQSFTLDGVAGAPTMVVFDDGNRILKELTFAQPVSWLAEQLRRDANLWDRAWTIEQLAAHRDDPAAAAALVDAALHADYFLTRAQAVEALAAFPQGMVLGTPIDASEDSSAAVRTAAVSTMRRFPGAAVIVRARALFEHDSSDAVRAAALETLMLLDPSHVHDALALALTMTSYRDVIRDAAFLGIVRTNDTSLVAGVDALIAQQGDAAQVLAVLGARGDSQALAVITGHLNDPRAGVRRWTLDAFANTMSQVDQAVALRQLRSALPGNRYPETRRGIADLIAQLEKP